MTLSSSVYIPADSSPSSLFTPPSTPALTPPWTPALTPASGNPHTGPQSPLNGPLTTRRSCPIWKAGSALSSSSPSPATPSFCFVSLTTAANASSLTGLGQTNPLVPCVLEESKREHRSVTCVCKSHGKSSLRLFLVPLFSLSSLSDLHPPTPRAFFFGVRRDHSPPN